MFLFSNKPFAYSLQIHLSVKKRLFKIKISLKEIIYYLLLFILKTLICVIYCIRLHFFILHIVFPMKSRLLVMSAQYRKPGYWLLLRTTVSHSNVCRENNDITYICQRSCFQTVKQKRLTNSQPLHGYYI